MHLKTLRLIHYDYCKERADMRLQTGNEEVKCAVLNYEHYRLHNEIFDDLLKLMPLLHMQV